MMWLLYVVLGIWLVGTLVGFWFMWALGSGLSGSDRFLRLNLKEFFGFLLLSSLWPIFLGYGIAERLLEKIRR
jgi:hypothetical protein